MHAPAVVVGAATKHPTVPPDVRHVFSLHRLLTKCPRRTARCRRLLRDLAQDRCLARLGPGAWRVALFRGCPPGCWVWLSFGLLLAERRGGVWLKRGLPSSK